MTMAMIAQRTAIAGNGNGVCGTVDESEDEGGDNNSNDQHDVCSV